MGLAKFMSTPLGRGLRIAVGVMLIVIGLSMGSTQGYVLAVVGLLPIAMGAGNFCLLAPLLKVSFRGSDLK